MVICLERDADLHVAQLMPLPLTVSCFSKIQIGYTFLVLAHPGSPKKRAVKRVCVCVCAHCCLSVVVCNFYSECYASNAMHSRITRVVVTSAAAWQGNVLTVSVC